MTDQTNKALQDFSAGKITGDLQKFSAIVDGKRLHSGILKYLVETMRKDSFTDTQILNVILVIDEKVESGTVTNEELDKLLKTELPKV